jgi:hypothetical protein
MQQQQIPLVVNLFGTKQLYTDRHKKRLTLKFINILNEVPNS